MKIYILVIPLGILALFPQLAGAAITLESTDQSVAELLASIIGGAGIFLVGIHFAGDYLQQMTSGTVQTIVSRVAHNRVGMFLWGIFLGFFTQSGKAAAFILSDFVRAGLIKPREASPMVYWGNAGSSLITFVSMLSVKIFALMLLGVTAFGLIFHFPKRLLHAYGAMFGLGMIIFGLYLVKEGAAGFAGMVEMSAVVELVKDSHLLSFLLGLLLTLVVQSNIAVMLIIIAMTSAGLFGLEEAAMGIFGAQAGTGVLTWIFSQHAKGSARQVVITQVIFDGIATSTFLGLFYLEYWLGLPFLLTIAQGITDSIGGQAIAVALGFQFGAAALLVLLRGPAFDWIENRFPPTATERLSEPRFLHKNAADSPETGLLLTEREQRRLLKRRYQ
jgi:phosphate:Na+ symporter